MIAVDFEINYMMAESEDIDLPEPRVANSFKPTVASPPKIATRKEFPESWIWQTFANSRLVGVAECVLLVVNVL